MQVGYCNRRQLQAENQDGAQTRTTANGPEIRGRKKLAFEDLFLGNTKNNHNATAYAFLCILASELSEKKITASCTCA